MLQGTLLNKLLEEHPGDFGFSVSHTTRAPRAGEVDGVHYHFCGDPNPNPNPNSSNTPLGTAGLGLVLGLGLGLPLLR